MDTVLPIIDIATFALLVFVAYRARQRMTENDHSADNTV
jgi:multisubunit Na+/H+ antiporter MnhC subunit